MEGVKILLRSKEPKKASHQGEGLCMAMHSTNHTVLDGC